MTEKKRTAAQIRAYCEAASDGPWVTGPEGAYWPIAKYQPDLAGVCKYQDILAAEAGNADNNADFIVNARTDLPRVLDAAEGLRAAYLELRAEHLALTGKGVTLQDDTLIAETAWLEGSDEKANREAD